MSWTKGRHFMKFGFDAVRDRFNGNYIKANVYGQYDFTGTYTGTGYADFLLGIPQTTTLRFRIPTAICAEPSGECMPRISSKYRSRLTVIYGVRWELEQPYTDTKGAHLHLESGHQWPGGDG